MSLNELEHTWELFSIKKNLKKQPPNIVNDDIVTNISFSPSADIIAVGTMEGDVCL